MPFCCQPALYCKVQHPHFQSLKFLGSNLERLRHVTGVLDKVLKQMAKASRENGASLVLDFSRQSLCL